MFKKDRKPAVLPSLIESGALKPAVDTHSLEPLKLPPLEKSRKRKTHSQEALLRSLVENGHLECVYRRPEEPRMSFAQIFEALTPWAGTGAILGAAALVASPFADEAREGDHSASGIKGTVQGEQQFVDVQNPEELLAVEDGTSKKQ